MPSLPIPDWSPRDFFELAETYSQRVAAAVPGFVATVAKWRPEDLIPGLSDIDTRIICQEMKADQWMAFDQVVCDVHLDLVGERPEWCRKLEHQPGFCQTPAETFDPLLYQAEMAHWTQYSGDVRFARDVSNYMASRQWGQPDELHHLKRWLMFWGPYNRTIDPPINISTAIEPKYALHSRAMHYFVPSLQAALSLLIHRTAHGKREALYRWLERCPSEPVLQETAHMLDVHYDVPALHDREALYAYEARCNAFLRQLAPEVLGALTVVKTPQGDDVDAAMAAVCFELASISADPLAGIHNALRGSRARRARYWLYVKAPDYFATEWLARNEVGFLQRNFTRDAWRDYAALRWQDGRLPLEQLLVRAQPHPLGADEAGLVAEMFAIAERSKQATSARQALQEAAERYGDYYSVLDKIYRDARQRVLGGES
jgi:hypothetical protein